MDRQQPDLEVVSRKISEARKAGYLDPVLWWIGTQIERMGEPMPIDDATWPLKRASRDGNIAGMRSLLSWIESMTEAANSNKPPEGA